MSKAEFNKSMLVMQGVKPEVAAHIVGQVETLKQENEQIRVLLGAALLDSDRLDWLEKNPLQATIAGLPADAKAYSIVTQLPLRTALDVMRKRLTPARLGQ